jgi:hypothetical protein
MRIPDHVSCIGFPCQGVLNGRFTVSPLEVGPRAIRCVMVAETPAVDAADDVHAPGDPFFMQTTRQAFSEAGVTIRSMDDLTSRGVYLTTAVKCAKVGHAVPKETIASCSRLLETGLGLFPHLRVIVALGEVAIRVINEIGRRRYGRRVIPSGPTYRLRGAEYYLGRVRVLPSYL